MKMEKVIKMKTGENIFFLSTFKNFSSQIQHMLLSNISYGNRPGPITPERKTTSIGDLWSLVKRATGGKDQKENQRKNITRKLMKKTNVIHNCQT